MNTTAKSRFSLVLMATILIGASVGYSAPCIVPDNGTGTATMPPIGCGYTSPDEAFMIVEGLPVGTTLEMPGVWTNFSCCQSQCEFCSLTLAPGECEGVGGSLGGNFDCFESYLDLEVTGTGDLAGFHRTLSVLVVCEVHTGPRNPGDPVQTFNTVIYRLEGELFGDPDFCEFRIRAGEDFVLPSPGQTTLTQLPSGDFAVDSFFDITYQIEFEGCPDSQLADYAGITTGALRMQTQGLIPCQPLPDGSACQPGDCLETGGQCLPVAVNHDPATGITLVTDCDCRDPQSCHVDYLPPVDCPTACVLPDNGTGTATLPPVGCEYASPDETFMIVDGLPAGTTMELPGIMKNFACCVATACPACSMPFVSDECEMPGGSLGGDGHCFEAVIEFDVIGTGELTGFSRHLEVYVTTGEVHTGPRNPGDPVQTFDADVYRLQGELFGDPDFCTFRILAGTDFGLPCPGQTTLTKLPSGDFAVDSFFDITYQIEFEGCPDSQLADYAGTTTGTLRMQTGCGIEPPTCVGDCPPGYQCHQTEVNNPDGTVDISCDCIETFVIQAGPDYWATPAAEMDFAGDPLPSDFFGPGSDPFDGAVYMTGQPIDPSSALADTIIERLHDVAFTAPAGSEVVDIEMVELNLVSTQPILVTSNGGVDSELYDVTLTLDSNASSTGQMTITKTHENGGTFDAYLNVPVVFTFEDRFASSYTYVLPLNITATAPYPWQDTPPVLTVRPPCIDTNFYPSGMGPLTLNPGILAGFHKITHRDPLPMDFDKDGDVDLEDFAVFASRWLHGV